MARHTVIHSGHNSYLQRFLMGTASHIVHYHNLQMFPLGTNLHTLCHHRIGQLDKNQCRHYNFLPYKYKSLYPHNIQKDKYKHTFYLVDKYTFHRDRSHNRNYTPPRSCIASLDRTNPVGAAHLLVPHTYIDNEEVILQSRNPLDFHNTILYTLARRLVKVLLRVFYF